jgi:sec-independent protein translocase protein TatC
MGKPRFRPAEDADADPSDPSPEDDVQMGFLEHIGELRKRLLWSMLGLVPGVCVAWYFKEVLLAMLAHPLAVAWNKLGLGEPKLHFANPIDGFVAYMQIALVVGVLIASPWIFWQVWSFISPGLYRREKRLAIPFVLASTIFFAGGAFFGYLVVFPLGFETFLGFAGQLPNQEIRIEPTIMLDEYLGFSLKMLIAFGVTFEVPVIITFLAAAHIVDWKQLLKFFRWWCLIAAVISALLTPPDVGSQLLMLVPLVLLYLLSIVFAFIVGRKKPKPVEAEP